MTPYPSCRLSDCCVIKPPKSEARRLLNPDELVSFVPMENLGINSKTLTLEKTRKLADVSGSYTYFADKDVLLAKITPCFENGKLGIANGLTNGIGFGSSEFIVFRPQDNLTPEYLYYFLVQPSFRTLGQSIMTGAVGHRRVPKEFIENTEIPLPPVPEQQRIVAILDQAFAEIEKTRANAEQNLKNARELFDSYLQQVFRQRGDGWAKFNLGDIADVNSGGTPTKSTNDYWNGNIPWYSSGELNNLRTVASKEMITPKGLQESNAKLFPKGSLLIGMYDTAALKMSLLDRDGCFNQAIAGVKPNDKINLVFIYHTINYLKPELLLLRRGVRQKNLNQSKIKNISIGLPSKEEQDEVVFLLEKLKKQSDILVDIYTRKLVALDELKKSLLQKAFSGELTNREGIAA